MLGGVATTELKPVYLLSGSDRPKIARALRRLRDRIGDDATEQLNARESSGDDAVATCNAHGALRRRRPARDRRRGRALEGGRRQGRHRLPRGAGAGDRARARRREIKADAALAKAVAKAGEVLTYEVPKRELPEWVAEQFARLGAKADRDACRALVEIVGDDLDELSSEIDKLATWAGGRHDHRCATSSSSPPDAPRRRSSPLTDAWGRRDVAGVLASTESLLERTHRTRSGELLRMSRSLVEPRRARAHAASGSPTRASGRATRRAR